MKIFNSIEEIKKYYNPNTNTYEFAENGERLDVQFDFDLSVDSYIYAEDIKAKNIKAKNINAGNIKAKNINAWEINARDINACDINAWDIKAGYINAGDINAWEINARDINACDIKAWFINASDISYYGVCFAYENITCRSIKGRRENAKHFCLDGEITIVEDWEMIKK